MFGTTIHEILWKIWDKIRGISHKEQLYLIKIFELSILFRGNLPETHLVWDI